MAAIDIHVRRVPGRPEGLTLGQRRVRVFLTTGTLLLLGLAAFSVDCAVARWCLGGGCPGPLDKFLTLIEPFGHGLGVPVILAAVATLDPRRRWALPRLAACAYLPGLGANLLKAVVYRARPNAFDFQGDVWSSFGGWLPLTGGGNAGQSFPSAHTATAVGLAIGLAWVYPRGRWLFAALGVAVAYQRVETGLHFPSDVLVGGALGVLVASSCTHIGVLRRLFAAIERHCRTLQKRPADPKDVDAFPPEDHETLVIRRLFSRAA